MALPLPDKEETTRLPSDTQGKTTIIPCVEEIARLLSDTHGNTTIIPCTEKIARLPSNTQGRTTIIPCAENTARPPPAHNSHHIFEGQEVIRLPHNVMHNSINSE